MAWSSRRRVVLYFSDLILNPKMWVAWRGRFIVVESYFISCNSTRSPAACACLGRDKSLRNSVTKFGSKKVGKKNFPNYLVDDYSKIDKLYCVRFNSHLHLHYLIGIILVINLKMCIKVFHILIFIFTLKMLIWIL